MYCSDNVYAYFVIVGHSFLIMTNGLTKSFKMRPQKMQNEDKQVEKNYP
jgi:hypothetical protein